MDREIAPGVIQRRVVKRVVTAIIGVVAVAFFFAASVEWLPPSIER